MKNALPILKAGAVLAALAVTAGCSGGGSSPSAPRPISSSPASGSTQPSSFGKSNASATVLIKSRTSAKRANIGSRKRAYISPATQGLIATFVDNANNTTYQGFTLKSNTPATAQSPATCGAPAGDGSYTCTLYFSLTSTASPYTATLTTYDAAQSGTSGTPAAAQGAASAIALSTATEPISIVANEANNFSFTLSGIVEAFEAAPQYIGTAAVPSPTASPLTTTFHALDGDFYLIDAVDQTTTFAVGTQPTGPFTSPAPFAVTASDESTATCGTSPCVALTSPAPVIQDPTTEGIGFTYNGTGASGDGVTTAPYYGLIGVTGPTGYAGATSQGTSYAATAYVVPFFGIVDPTNDVQRTDASDVSFTNPSDTVNVYALQYHIPDGSAGYSIDASSCGSIASASAGTPLASGYGESFTLSAGSASGTCTVTLGDGAGDTATINVTSTAAGGTSVTVPCTSGPLSPDSRGRSKADRKRDVTTTPCAFPFVQQVTVAAMGNDDGTGYNFVVQNPGDMLVCVFSDHDGTFFPNVPANYEFFDNYDQFDNALTPAGLFIEAVDTANPGDSLVVAPAIGPNLTWCGEIAGYEANSISPYTPFDQNNPDPSYFGSEQGPTIHGGFQSLSATTPAVVPPAAGSVVITAVVGNDTVPYNTSPGYTTVYSALGSAQSLDVQVRAAKTTDASTPVSNTFAGGDGNPLESAIVMFAPTSGPGPMIRNRHASVVHVTPKNTYQIWQQIKH